MIIECFYCESKVDAKVLSEHTKAGTEDYPFATYYYFLECPSCKNPMVATNEDTIDDDSNLTQTLLERVWPAPIYRFHPRLPIHLKNLFEEAQKCYQAKAYRACAVMCGTVLECVCLDHTSKRYLAEGLKELLDKKIIDSRIYEWGEALRQHRNIGAHAGTQDITKEDAKDLLDFTNAICDYIYVLTKKFEDFKERQKKKYQE